MPIDPISGPATMTSGAKARRRQTGFSVPEPGGEPSEAPAEAMAASPVPLLTMQAAGMEEAEAASDREAARQGEGLLGALRQLQLAMLGGSGGQDALATLAGNLPPATDPRLNAVLLAIAQRAAVECARRG